MPNCPEHNRVYECYDIELRKYHIKTYFVNFLRLICATCIMFGESKGHKVVSIGEAVKYLRLTIDKSVKEGILL